MKDFKIRSSRATDIAGENGLTNNQIKRLDELHKRKVDELNGVPKVKPLTENMEKELVYLIDKRDNPELPEGAKTYCKEWLVSELTGKRKEIDSKYLTHGIELEPLAIERAAKYYNIDLVKNEEFLENEFMHGTFDTATDEMVIDTKCSWDAFTFPYFMEEPPKKYVDQLQCYMHLTGKKKASLVYCLENGTPDEIERLSWKLSKKEAKQLGVEFEEPEMKHWDEAEKQLNYDHLPESMRIKVFEFEYDAEFIKALEARVIECREYINNELMKYFK